MTAGHAHLLAFASAMTRGDEPGARRALRAARRARVPRSAAEETGLMLMLHAGYPAALEGMRVLLETWPGRSRRSREGTVVDWGRRGERLCRRVYGPVYDRLLKRVEALHPDLAVWMVEQGYGRVLSRPRLSARMRELVAVTVLAAGGWERQLTSHLLGAVRLGAGAGDIRKAFRTGLTGATRGVRTRAARAWKHAFGESPGV